MSRRHAKIEPSFGTPQSDLFADVEQRPVQPARAPRPTEDVDAPISPGDIVARAAAMVPENRDPDSEKNRLRPLDLEPDVRSDAHRVPTLPPAAINPPARRRPAPLLLVGLWRGILFLRFAPVLLALAVGPIWAWHEGHIQALYADASGTIERWTTTAKTKLNLRVSEVLIAGRKRTGMAPLRAALRIQKGDDISVVDLAAARRRLEALPWVARATISRRLPSTLYVRVTEKTAIARFARGKTVRLIAADGNVIDDRPHRDHSDLLLLSGMGAPKTAAALLTLIDSSKRLASRVVSATRRGDRRWDLTLRVRGRTVRVLLPEQHATAAWRKLDAIDVRHALLARGPIAVDMRLFDRMVIRLPDVPKEDGAVHSKKVSAR